MTIAIDFDKTFTADPELWLSFIRSASLRGHEIICATYRKEYSDDMPGMIQDCRILKDDLV